VKFFGVSGGIGSGKSTVLTALGARGAATIDIDAVNRALQEPGQPLFVRIVERWGGDVVGPDGRLDRPALSAIAFADRGALAELTGMAAPLIEREVVQQASVHVDDPDAVVAVESALYLQPMYGMSGMVVVDVPVEVAVHRLVEARGMSEVDARARVASQIPREVRLEHADHVVHNDGTLDSLDGEIASLLDWIREQPAAVPALDRGATTRP